MKKYSSTFMKNDKGISPLFFWKLSSSLYTYRDPTTLYVSLNIYVYQPALIIEEI